MGRNSRQILKPNRRMPFADRSNRLNFYDDRIINIDIHGHGIKRRNERAPSPYRNRSKRPRQNTTPQHETPPHGIKMAVMHLKHPAIQLTQQEYDSIRSKLCRELEKTNTDWSVDLEFVEMDYSAGIFWVTCANRRTVNWTWEVVHSIETKIGLRLRVVEPKFVPNRCKVAIDLEGRQLESEVRAVLSKKLPNLKTINWVFVTSFRSGSRQVLEYEIDFDSFQILQKSDLKMQHKAEIVTFTI